MARIGIGLPITLSASNAGWIIRGHRTVDFARLAETQTSGIAGTVASVFAGRILCAKVVEGLSLRRDDEQMRG